MADLVRFLSLLAAFAAIAGLLIVFGVFRSCSRSASEAEIAEEIMSIPPAFNLTASQLVQAYLDDEESAEATYNGQVGIVRGAYLGLWKASDHFNLFGNDVWTVRCFTSNAETDRVRDRWDSLKQTYVFERGWSGRSKSVGGPSRILVMKGRVDGINNKFLSVDLRGCTFYDSP